MLRRRRPGQLRRQRPLPRRRRHRQLLKQRPLLKRRRHMQLLEHTDVTSSQWESTGAMAKVGVDDV